MADTTDKLSSRKIGLEVHSSTGPGILHQLTGAIAAHHGNIISVMIVGEKENTERVFFDVDVPGDAEAIVADLKKLPPVQIGRAHV